MMNRVHSPRRLTLTAAKVIASLVEKKAEELGVRAVVALTDEGGNLILTERTDDAFIASIDIAQNKAFTSVSLKMATKDLCPLAQPGKPLYGIQHTNKGRIVIFGGGVPLEWEGSVIGGLGVSGGSAEDDTLLGDYGLTVFREVMNCL